MKYTLRIVAILISWLTLTTMAQPIELASLQLEIERIRHLNKPIYIRIDAAKGQTIDFNADEEDAVALKVVTPEQESTVVTFEKLQPGQYFIRVYQDLNANQQLDISDGGYPIEPWGLSNNPILFDEPNIEDVAIEIKPGIVNQYSISLRQRKTHKRRRR